MRSSLDAVCGALCQEVDLADGPGRDWVGSVVGNVLFPVCLYAVVN